MDSSENAAKPYFDIQIAERIIRIYPLTSGLSRFCRDYVVFTSYPDRMPAAGMDHSGTGAESAAYDTDITVGITLDDIGRERELAERKIPPLQVSDAYLETLALARKVSAGLLNFDTLLFHASCIAVDGEGYCFTAPSGVGKSTHARLWKDMLGEKVIYINDDKPFLKIDDASVTAYGSPWDGGHHLGANLSVPVKAVYLLSRGEKNFIKDINADEAYPLLLGQVYRPHDEGALKKILPLVERLCKSVRLFSLQCNKNPEAAVIAYEAKQNCC